jgi:hypothetical protein
MPPRRPLRRANQPPGAVPNTICPYTKGTGYSALLALTEGYNDSDSYDAVPSTFIPSFLALKGAIFLTTTQFLSHDRFLKSCADWHPLMDELYMSFCFIYHILRCRRQLGTLSPAESLTLSELELVYPPNQLHIPGVYAHFFQSMTVSPAPYPWLSFVGPSLPYHFETGPAGSNGFMPTQNAHMIFPNPALLVDLMHRFCNQNQAANTITTIFDRAFSADAMTDANPLKSVYLSPHARLPIQNSNRVETAFRQATVRRQVSTFDLPARYTHNAAHTTVCTVSSYMGVLDYSEVANPVMRYRQWPNSYSAVMAKQCQYIADSRTLNDMPLNGLGSPSVIWTFDPFLVFKVDEIVADPADPANAAPITEAQRATMFMTSLAATGSNRDPELEQIALQVSAMAQTNISFGPMHGTPADADLRDGAYWQMPACSTSPQFDVAARLYNGIPLLVRSTTN